MVFLKWGKRFKHGRGGVKANKTKALDYGWQDRWVKSDWKRSEGKAGSFKHAAGNGMVILMIEFLGSQLIAIKLKAMDHKSAVNGINFLQCLELDVSIYIMSFIDDPSILSTCLSLLAQKKVSFIGAWENGKKASVEAELKKIEIVNNND
ncbi:hypothetical protein CASFOL_031716 [Castilleja foliolosa]|uniref:Uncharacterized protein n=1 Tax=Castilleja foliolosa TaxID=1961234 RepID=A0ABD3C5G9_9LAMI